MNNTTESTTTRGIHFIETGTGPPLVLLHGFPQFWYTWRHQIPALAAAGCHVIAPDLRGYNLSVKPAGVESYTLEHLVEDIADLIRSHAGGRAVVAGHDWGGVIAWALAMEHPELVDRLVILNAPHPEIFRQEVRRPGQMLRSIYQLYFQLPKLPEISLRAFDWWLVRRLFRNDPRRRCAITEEDIDRYCAALAEPGALTAALDYYRAIFRHRSLLSERWRRRVDMPVLQIWGRFDRYLGIRLAQRTIEYAPHSRRLYLDASHWVHEELPEEVNRQMIDFINTTR